MLEWGGSPSFLFSFQKTSIPKKSFHYSGPLPMRSNEFWTCPDTEPPGWGGLLLVVNGVSCWVRSRGRVSQGSEKNFEPRDRNVFPILIIYDLPIGFPINNIISQTKQHTLSAWEWLWKFECFCAYTIWLFLRWSLHASLRRVSLICCLSLSFSGALSLSPYHRVSLALSKVCMQCISFLLSPALALSRSSFQPFSRLHLSLSMSLAPFQRQSPDPLILSPTTLPRLYSCSSVCVHAEKSDYFWWQATCINQQ